MASGYFTYLSRRGKAFQKHARREEIRKHVRHLRVIEGNFPGADDVVDKYVHLGCAGQTERQTEVKAKTLGGATSINTRRCANTSPSIPRQISSMERLPFIELPLGPIIS